MIGARGVAQSNVSGGVEHGAGDGRYVGGFEEVVGEGVIIFEGTSEVILDIDEEIECAFRVVDGATGDLSDEVESEGAAFGE